MLLGLLRQKHFFLMPSLNIIVIIVVDRIKKDHGKSGRSTPQGSRISLFKRFSSEGLPRSVMRTQRTAPGELCGFRHGAESPFAGMRPVNRLRSQTSVLQVFFTP